MKKISKKTQGLIIVLLLCAPFICLELVSRSILESKYTEKDKKAFRVLLGFDKAYSATMLALYKPHHYLIYTLNPDYTTHHEQYFGSKGYYINKRGFRGKDFPLRKKEGAYRIVCLGGSTTFGQGETDEMRTYPQLLEDALNQKFSSPVFEVINAGTPAWTSAEILINLQFRILELSPDMIIVYEGVNDTFAMRRDGEGNSDYSNFRRIMNFAQPGPAAKALLRASAFLRLVYISTYDVSTDITKATIAPGPLWTNEEKNLDLATGKYFRNNMMSIAAIARAHNIVTVFVTMGHGPWHSSLELNNAITRATALEHGAVLIDFQKAAHPSYFTEDNVHLTKAGNAALAREVVAALSNPDFNFVVRAGK